MRDISRELMSGENVVWSGAPGKGLRLQWSDALLIPFSIVWGGFVISAEVEALTRPTPTFFVLWGIPFVVVGLHLMVGRFFTDAQRRAHSHYFLTQQRALILKTWPTRHIQSVDLRYVGAIERTSHRDGTTTLAFGLACSERRRRVERPKFEWIKDGQAVYELVLAAQYEDDDDDDDDDDET